MTDSVTQVKACKKCGTAERYENGRCKRCAVLRAAAWHKANPEKAREIRAAHRARKPETAASWYARNAATVRARTAAYRAANPDKVKAKNAAWRAKNTDKIKAQNEAWFAANPGAARIYSQNRRARKRANGGRLSAGLERRLFKLQRGKCACGCGQPLGTDYHLDHRMPLALGGSHADNNIQLLRAKCNLQKNAKHPIDYMQSKGFLL